MMKDRVGQENKIGKSVRKNWRKDKNEECHILGKERQYEKGRAWLRRPVVRFSERRIGFDSRSVHVGFMVDSVSLGRSVPCHFHSTNAQCSLICHRRYATSVTERCTAACTFVTTMCLKQGRNI
jgi:hypothetical protein